MAPVLPRDHSGSTVTPISSSRASGSTDNLKTSQELQYQSPFGNFQASPQQLNQPNAQVLVSSMAASQISENISSTENPEEEHPLNQPWRNRSGQGVGDQDTTMSPINDPEGPQNKAESSKELSSWQELTPLQQRENWIKNRKRRQRPLKGLDQFESFELAQGEVQKSEKSQQQGGDKDNDPEPTTLSHNQHSRQSSSIDFDKAFREWSDKNRGPQHKFSQYSGSPGPELLPISASPTPALPRLNIDKPRLQRQAVIQSHFRRVSQEAPQQSQEQPHEGSLAKSEEKQQLQPQHRQNHLWTSSQARRQVATASASEIQQPRRGVERSLRIGRGRGTLWDPNSDGICPGRRQGILYEPGKYAPRSLAPPAATKEITAELPVSADVLDFSDTFPTSKSPLVRSKGPSSALSGLFNKSAMGGERDDISRSDVASWTAATSTPLTSPRPLGTHSRTPSRGLARVLSPADVAATKAANSTAESTPTPAVATANTPSPTLIAPTPLRFPLHSTLPPIESTKLVQPPPGFRGLVPRRILISPMPVDPERATSSAWEPEYGVGPDHEGRGSFDATVDGRRGSHVSSTGPTSFNPVVGSGQPR